MTRGISNSVADNEMFAMQVNRSLGLYLKKDWGEASESSKEMNDENAEIGFGSLLGVYNTCEGNIWIMTEYDRSVTTILFPHEY